MRSRRRVNSDVRHLRAHHLVLSYRRRTTRMVLLSFLLITTLSHPAHSQTVSDVSQKDTFCSKKSAKILILGTYHMDNPRLDSKNIEADDVLLPRRQREISDLIEKLAQ